MYWMASPWDSTSSILSWPTPIAGDSVRCFNQFIWRCIVPAYYARYDEHHLLDLRYGALRALPEIPSQYLHRHRISMCSEFFNRCHKVSRFALDFSNRRMGQTASSTNRWDDLQIRIYAVLAPSSLRNYLWSGELYSLAAWGKLSGRRPMGHESPLRNH